MMLKRKKLLIWALTLMTLGFIATVGIYSWMERQAKASLFDEVEKLPETSVALVLGTNKLIAGIYKNPYFESRMDAAALLYHKGKVKHLLLSGDNSTKGYNEPADMQEALLDRGVPASAISLDYAGFRTLDSVIRAKAVFQQEKMVIVSQAFHNVRALFIARRKGVEAIGFNAKTPGIHAKSKVRWREYLARVKAVLDVYVLNKKARYYGEKIDLPIS